MPSSHQAANSECVAELHKIGSQHHYAYNDHHNTNHHTSSSSAACNDGGNAEDVMIHNKLLEARNAEMQRSRGKLEDELGLMRHQLRIRDKRLEASADKVNTLEATIARLQRVIEEKEKIVFQHKSSKHELLDRIDALTEDNLKLRAELEGSGLMTTTKWRGGLASSSSSAFSPASTANLSSKKDQFAQLMEHKVMCVVLRRKLRESRRRHMDVMAKGEAMAMETEDQRSYINDMIYKNGGNSVVNLKNLARRTSTAAGASGAEDGEVDKVMTAAEESQMKAYYKSTNKPVVFGGGSGGSDDAGGNFYYGPYSNFPSCPLELQTRAEEEFLASKLRQSAYKDILAALEGEMAVMATRAKEAHDKHQGALWHVFTEATRRGGCVLANPKQDYLASLATGLRAYNMALHGLMRTLRDYAVKLVNSERSVREAMERDIRAEIASNKTSVATQADIESAEMVVMGEKISYLEATHRESAEKHRREVSALEDARSKAEINAQYLQSKAFEWHESVYDALSAVHRHRFQWIGTVPNVFADVMAAANSSSTDTSTIHYNLRIGKAIDEERSLLGKFAHYFLSKDLFGTANSATAAASSNSTNNTANAANNADGLAEYQRTTKARARVTDTRQNAKTSLEAAQRLLKQEEKEMKAKKAEEEKSKKVALLLQQRRASGGGGGEANANTTSSATTTATVARTSSTVARRTASSSSAAAKPSASAEPLVTPRGNNAKSTLMNTTATAKLQQSRSNSAALHNPPAANNNINNTSSSSFAAVKGGVKSAAAAVTNSLANISEGPQESANASANPRRAAVGVGVGGFSSSTSRCDGAMVDECFLESSTSVGAFSAAQVDSVSSTPRGSAVTTPINATLQQQQQQQQSVTPNFLKDSPRYVPTHHGDVSPRCTVSNTHNDNVSGKLSAVEDCLSPPPFSASSTVTIDNNYPAMGSLSASASSSAGTMMGMVRIGGDLLSGTDQLESPTASLVGASGYAHDKKRGGAARGGPSNPPSFSFASSSSVAVDSSSSPASVAHQLPSPRAAFLLDEEEGPIHDARDAITHGGATGHIPPSPSFSSAVSLEAQRDRAFSALEKEKERMALLLDGGSGNRNGSGTSKFIPSAPSSRRPSPVRMAHNSTQQQGTPSSSSPASSSLAMVVGMGITSPNAKGSGAASSTSVPSSPSKNVVAAAHHSRHGSAHAVGGSAAVSSNSTATAVLNPTTPTGRPSGPHGGTIGGAGPRRRAATFTATSYVQAYNATTQQEQRQQNNSNDTVGNHAPTLGRTSSSSSLLNPRRYGASVAAGPKASSASDALPMGLGGLGLGIAVDPASANTSFEFALPRDGRGNSPQQQAPRPLQKRTSSASISADVSSGSGNGAMPSMAAASAVPATTVTTTRQPLTRMASWHQQQQEQWERKRQTSIAEANANAPTILFVTNPSASSSSSAYKYYSSNKENVAVANVTLSTVDANKWVGGLSRTQSYACASASAAPTGASANGVVFPVINNTAQPLGTRRMNAGK